MAGQEAPYLDFGSGRLLQALVVAYPYPWLSIIRRPPALMLSWAWTLLRSEHHFLAPGEPPTFGVQGPRPISTSRASAQ